MQDIIFYRKESAGSFAHILRDIVGYVLEKSYMILMTMSVEYGFMLFLVLREYLCHQLFVLFRSRWFAIARKVLPKVYENSGGISPNLCYTTAYLVKPSMYLDVH